MSQSPSTLLDALLMKLIQAAGSLMPTRQALNFIGFTLTDNPTNNSTDVALGTPGGGGTVDIPAQETILGFGTAAPVTGGTFFHTTTTTGAETVLDAEGNPVSFAIAPGACNDFALTAVGTDGSGNAFRADYAFNYVRNGSGAAGLLSGTSTSPQNTPSGNAAWAGLTVVETSNVVSFQVQSASGVFWKVIVQAQ